MRTAVLRPLLFLLFTAALIAGPRRTMPLSVLQDKIAGGWAGKMIGVTYGAPAEFRAQGHTFEESITWTPKNIPESVWQDDIYVQLTFMMTMDRCGIDAPARTFQEMFAKAGYMLWHANVQARKNYYDGILPPRSGAPAFNPHADDIDFQIEADYLGFISPGMPRTASRMAWKIGHIMNHGDGVYGGIFVAALHAQAFFSDDVHTVVADALRSLPPASDYATMINDVILLHERYPTDWRKAWSALEERWGADHFCEAGGTFNIDAKVNGAYIVMGLLYGDGDIARTLEVTTRCGQDADCNPSSAMAVLGVMKGFNALPEAMRQGVLSMKDSLFINTDYSFVKAVERTTLYAKQNILRSGGAANDSTVQIAVESPAAAPLEISFPEVIVKGTASVFDSTQWTRTGTWDIRTRIDWKTKEHMPHSFASSANGAALTLTFTGTGAALYGDWLRNGGRADIALDGKKVRTIDTYYFYNGQEHENMVVYHATGLRAGRHRLTVTVRGEQRPGSLGKEIGITKAVIFATAPKRSTVHTLRMP